MYHCALCSRAHATSLSDLQDVWQRLSARLTLQRYAEVVQPVLLFGCETWALCQTVMQDALTALNSDRAQ